jgi:hypothetical protein
MCHQQEEDWVLCRVICKTKSGGGGAAAKPARGRLATNGHDTATTTASPPLPTLMDTTLAQLQAAMNTAGAGAGAIEQVPCFSSFNNNIASSSSSAAHQPCYLPMATSSNGTSYLDHGLPELVGSCFDPLNSDKKLLKAVLSQFGGGEVMPSLPPDMAAAASSAWMNHF